MIAVVVVGGVFQSKNFIGKNNDDSHSLSLVEGNSALSQVVADPEVCSRVHVLGVKHHASVPMRWSKAVHSVMDKL